MPLLPDQVPESTLRLVLASGIGPVTLTRLRASFGSDDAVVDATVAALRQVERIGAATAEAIRRAIDEADVDGERAAMRAGGVGLVLEGDEDYPPLLAAIADPPPALWIRGTFAREDRLAVGIVGSRRCTSYGREQAGRFAALLAEVGLTIVSGGALGIDGEAHRGASRVGGRTIVVLGCGLGRCYPPEHESLFARIVEDGGAIVSEHAMGVEPLAQHFPRRNRIISGLSLGVLVIEAAKRSGALITARLAAEEHGREVMAVPGRVDSPASAGSLKLIQDGGAAMVLDHADVLRQLDASSQLVRGALEAAGHADAKSSTTLFDGNLTDGQRAIVSTLEDVGNAMHADELAARTGLPLHQLMADLTLLEIRGRVRKDQRGVRLVVD